MAQMNLQCNKEMGLGGRREQRDGMAGGITGPMDASLSEPRGVGDGQEA